jgi:hypothetical protein
MEPCAVSSGVNDSYVCASPGANVIVRPAAPGPFTSVARPVASTKTQWRVSSCTCRVPTFLNCARRPPGVSPRPRALRGGARVRAHLDLVRPPVGAPAVPLVVALSVDLQRARPESLAGSAAREGILSAAAGGTAARRAWIPLDVMEEYAGTSSAGSQGGSPAFCRTISG